MKLPVCIEDIRAAAERIRGHAIETPLLENVDLNQRTGASVFIKPESLQRSGSFKFRGAFNRLSQLNRNEREAGVVAWSSGNHAQGIAAAAQILDIPATIVMPHDAPSVKIKNTLSYGAQIVHYDRYKDDREAIGRHLAEKKKAILVPSYDDPNIIAGQGTCGLEIVSQLKSIGRTPDKVLVCCGGGGLIAGTSLAIKSHFPATEVYAVEPVGFDDHRKSLINGTRVENGANKKSICDALLAPIPGEVTFPINKTTLSGGLVVDDDEVLMGIAYAYSALKLVTEPGGVVALAALLSGKISAPGETVVIVLSGGNVDPDLFSKAISSSSIRPT
ncbi:MAG: threonine/serine dehydratase [Pseudomonadota bacterium]